MYQIHAKSISSNEGEREEININQTNQASFNSRAHHMAYKQHQQHTATNIDTFFYCNIWSRPQSNKI